MLRWCILVLALASAKAAFVQKSGFISRLDNEPIRFKRSQNFLPEEGPMRRSLFSDSDSDSDSDSSLEDEWKKPISEINTVNHIDKRSSRPGLGHGIVKRSHGVKRSLGVMENAGVGALSAAVQTISNTITSANVASGHAAGGGRPQYQGYQHHQQGYQQGHQQGYQQGYYQGQGYQHGYQQGSGYQQGYQEGPGYQQGYHQGSVYQQGYPKPYPVYPSRGDRLTSNVNNIKVVNGGY